MTPTQLDAIEDAKAAAAFDGPSTPEERLDFRIGVAIFDLYDIEHGARPGGTREKIAMARKIIRLLEQSST